MALRNRESPRVWLGGTSLVLSWAFGIMYCDDKVPTLEKYWYVASLS